MDNKEKEKTKNTTEELGEEIMDVIFKYDHSIFDVLLAIKIVEMSLIKAYKKDS